MTCARCNIPARGDLDPALADYTAAIGLNPNDSHFYTGRGYVFRKKGDLDGALADYTKAIAVNPKDWLAYDARGDIYRVSGRSRPRARRLQRIDRD